MSSTGDAAQQFECAGKDDGALENTHSSPCFERLLQKNSGAAAMGHFRLRISLVFKVASFVLLTCGTANSGGL